MTTTPRILTTTPDPHASRRAFLRLCGRSGLLAGLGALVGGLVARGQLTHRCPPDGRCIACAERESCVQTLPLRDTVWQLDPDQCIQCGQCATECVLSQSAVRCVHTYAMCGYCKLCFGYFQPGANSLNEAAENQVCPTGAIRRHFVEDPYFEYSIDEALCIGCAKCVKGCNAFGNGSLHLQVKRELCLDCNDCAIARTCPADAFKRVPAHKPYKMKEA